MNKFVILIWLYLLSTNTFIFGQIFSPVTFDGYTPKWTHYTMADSLSILTQAYNPEGKPIYKDGFLYLLCNIFDTAPNQGHIIEKIDYKTGGTEWNKWYYFDKINTREYASDLRFKGDTISIIVNKEINTNPILGFSLWFNSYLGNRSYSDKSGTVVESFFTNPMDSLNKNVPAPLSISVTTRNYFAKQKDYISIVLSPNSMRILNINMSGHHLDSVQTNLNNLSFAKGVWSGNINEDKILFISHSKLSGEDKENQQIKMYIIDHKLNIIFQKDITSLLPENGEEYELSSYNDRYFNIKCYQSQFNIFQPITFCNFDIEGNLIERIRIDDVLKTNIISESISSDGTMLIANSKDENGYSNISIYKSDGKGNTELKKHFRPSKSDDLLLINKMYYTHYNNVLLSFLHISRKLQNLPIVPKWRNWTLIDGIDLGIISSTNTFQLPHPQIYPNPVSGLLNIETTLIYNEIEIINIDGSLSKKEESSLKYIDVSSLPNGMYICNLKNNGKSIGQQRFIKI